MDSNLTLLLFCVICGFAATIHGAIGIGYPMIATPLLAMVTDVRTAILILVIPTIALNIINIVQGGGWRKSIGLYWPLAVYGAAGSFIGTRLLVVISPETFRPLLAAAILLYLNADRLGIGFPWVKRYPKGATAIFGLSAGFLGGTVNVMLPALVIFALEMKMEKNTMIQVFNFCFLFGKLIQGVVFAQAGFFTVEILHIALPLTLVSVVVLLSAISLRDKLNEQLYKKWLRRLLYCMSLVLVIQFAAHHFQVG